MKLHYGKLSSSSRRVTIAARMLGISLDENHVDLREPAARAELVKLNPNNKVPVLEDGDFVLWESNAINVYLCEQTPGQTLYPSELHARADVNRWLAWSAAHWSVACGGLGWENVWKKLVTGAGPDAEAVKRSETLFAQFATVLDGHLARASGLGPQTSAARRTSGWIVGDSITLADIAIATPLMYTRLAKLPVRPYANIRTWFARIRELPAWQATETPALGMLEEQFGVTSDAQLRPEA